MSRENSAHRCYLILRWRGRIFKRIVQPKRVPLVFAKLMEGKYINTLDITERRGKGSESLDVFCIVGKPGHEHVTQPYWTMRCSETAGKTQRRLKRLAGDFLVRISIPVFDVEQNQINVEQHYIVDTVAKQSRRINCRVIALCLHGM